MSNILINALGIQDSGGLTILKKTIQELLFDSENNYQILVFKGKYIDDLIDKSMKILYYLFMLKKTDSN